MNLERWQQIDELFQAAVELDPAQRADFLEKACADDHLLRSEVESMLASDSDQWDFVERPVLQMAAPLLADDRPQLASGENIGHYKIVAPIGRGGMGEVYLAEDERLSRKVALKLLLADFASDPSRMRRFKQEAHAASALNHPNIITIYEIGQSDVHYFIASEFIDGETLRQRLSGERISIEECLETTIQVANALLVAHEVGIVHRDIKPENIMLRRDGYVKVLDFGLAEPTRGRLLSEDVEQTEESDTEPGPLIGTVKYMSPEQARGQKVDTRSDLFSLGIVLYELVAGRSPFEGETARELMSAILNDEPLPLKQYAPEAPEELQIIVSKALRKERNERYQSADDLLVDLKKLKKKFELHTPGQYIISEIKHHKPRAIIALTTLILVIAGISFGMFKILVQKKGAMQSGAIKITELTGTGNARDAAISPDGKYVAYVIADAGRESIWIRQVETENTTEIVSPVEVRLAALTFSRDGNDLYYVKFDSQDTYTDALYKVSIPGGDSKKIIEQVHSPISFSPDGRQFAFFRRYPSENASTGENGLLIANDDGTGERELGRRKTPERFLDYPSGPAWSPDGKSIACGVRRAGRVELIEVRIADGSERTISSQDWVSLGGVSWLAEGKGLVVAALKGGDRPEEREILRVSYPGGEVERMLDGYAGISSAADSRVLVTVRQTLAANIWIVPTDNRYPARQITSGSSYYQGLCWMPDGKIVFAAVMGKSNNIWTMDADGTHQKRLTLENSFFPTASPDGRYIVFDSLRSGVKALWRMDIDGSNQNELIRVDGFVPPFAGIFTPDGKWVIVRLASGWWRVPIEGGDAVQLGVGQKAGRLAISPDGKWIAYRYSVNPAGPPLFIAIVPFEGQEPVKKLAVPSVDFAGWNPIKWAPDGRAVLYVSTQAGTSNIWSLPIDGSAPKQLTDFGSEEMKGFDLSPDGKQLACVRVSYVTDIALMSGIDK